MQAAGHKASAGTLTQLIAVSCRTGQRRQALAAYRARVALGAGVPPLEPPLLSSLVLTLGKSPGATTCVCAL